MNQVSSKLLDKIQSCTICSTINGYRKFSKESHGNIHANYMLVSEAPGKESLDQGRYWTGQGGRLLRSVLREFDKELESLFYLTDIVKCWPNENGNNRKPSQEEIKSCSRFIYNEIEELKPKLILAFGKIATQVLLNKPIRLKDAHGRVFPLNDVRVLVLYHPSQIDLRMDRSIYQKQLSLLFSALIKGDIDHLDSIFERSYSKDTENVPKQKSSKPSFSDVRRGTFILPAVGNSITEKDIQKNQLRITVDFKRYFPSSDRNITAIIKDKSYQTPLKFKPNRSYVWRLGKDAMRKLQLRAGEQLLVEKIKDYEYKLERIVSGDQA